VGSVKRVEVVSANAALAFTQDGSGLHVAIPPGASHDFGIALKISGDGLV
jgi:alpha-L-fucosidase